MSDKIAVIKPYYLKEEAYQMGHDRFTDVEIDAPGEFDTGPFKQTAAWANNVAPKLRAMAGFADGGHGTYQRGRQVAAIDPGAEEDEPAEAELTEAHLVFSELVRAYDMGAHDAVEDTFDPDAALA